MAGVSEYEVKAAFIFNFAKFTTWPGEEGRKDPFRICIVGGDPFGPVIDATVRGKQVRGRDLTVERHILSDDLVGCEIVFVGEHEPDQHRKLLNRLSGQPVLTIGDSKQFAADGGTVGFFRQKRRIRFTFNVDAVERSKLRVSSKLLQLSAVTRGSR